MFLPPPPRPRTREWRGHYIRSLLGAAVLAGIGVLFFLGSLGAKAEYELTMRVFDHGTAVQGWVVSKDYTRGKNSTTYYLGYHFEVGGAAYEARHSVPWSAYSGTQEGRPIEVVYDPANPATSYLVAERDRHTMVPAVILGILGVIGIGIAVIFWVVRSRHRWLWLHGAEVMAGHSMGRPPGYTFHYEGRSHTARAPVGQWVIQHHGRYAILIDPRDPTRATGITPAMISAGRLAEATAPERRVLPAAPRPDNPAWRSEGGTVAPWIVGLIIGGIAMLILGICVPMLVSRWTTRSHARQLEGVVVARSPSIVTYEVEGRRSSFGITTSQMVRYPVGGVIAVHAAGGQLYAGDDLSLTGPTVGAIIGGLVLFLAFVVVLVPIRAHWRTRVLWKQGIEIHAAVTSDSTHKGQRSIHYRYAHEEIEGSGSRSFPASDAPVPGHAAEMNTVVVLIDPLDARRSRLVLHRESR